LSGTSPEVLHNFGSGGASSSSVFGSKGTYGIYAEAYRRAAKKRGVLPRELQSVTWEASRGLFAASFKSQSKNLDATAAVWNAYRNRKLSLDDARAEILRLADGISPPDWARSARRVDAGAWDSSFQGEVPDLRVRVRGPAGPDAGGARGGAAEGTDGVDRLAQHQDYARATGPGVRAAAAGAPVGAPSRQVERSPSALKEASIVGRAAEPASVDPANPYGFEARRYRAKPNMTREELNVALGYRPDQTVYDAIDLQARIQSHIGAKQLRDRGSWDYVKNGHRTSVPRARIAGIEARVNQMLGDLPELVAQRRRDAGAPVGGVASTTTAATTLNLDVVQATRVRILIDHLVQSGWASDLPPNLRIMQVPDLQQYLTTAHWNTVVDALKDARSGSMSYEAKLEQYSTGAYLMWWLTKHRASPLTPGISETGQAPETVPLNTIKGRINDALTNLAFDVLPLEARNPNMPEWVKTELNVLRRRVQGAKAEIASRIEDLTTADRRLGGPGRASAAMAAVAGRAGIPIVDLNDLPALRAWLYTAAAPPVTAAPIPQRVRRDQPRVTPVTVQEIVQRRDLVQRTLIGNGGHRLDAETVDVLARLMQNPPAITREDAGHLFLKMHAALNAAKARGVEVLRAASGASGGKDKVANIIKGGEYSGVELDAYTAWHRGVVNGVDWWNAPRQPGSVANLVEQVLGVGTAVEVERWSFEIVAREYVGTLIDDFIDRLIDRDYVITARQLAESVDPNGPPRDVQAVAQFASDVHTAIKQILTGKDVELVGGYVGATVEEIAAGNYTLGPNGEFRGAFLEGKVNPTTMTPEVRRAAADLIARWRLIPDLGVERAGIHKGLGAADFNVINAAKDATNGQINLSAVLDNPQVATEATGLGASRIGRDALFPSELAAELEGLLETNAPVGEFFAGALVKDRDKAAVALRAYAEAKRMIAQHLIAGGPTLVAPLVAGAGALLISGSVPITTMVVGGLYAMTWLPPTMRYATNFMGAHLQAMLGIGAADTIRTLASPSIVRSAQVAVRESVRLTGLNNVVAAATSAAGMLLGGGKTDAEQRVIVTRDGRIFTVGDIVREAQARGLNGTQANYETLSGAAERIQKIVDTEPTASPNAKARALFRKVYGDNEIANNYRVFYESIDLYFRYAILIRSLEDGMDMDTAVQRTLLTTFDYTNAANLDKFVNQGVMFWMYQRRAIDLAVWALYKHPDRVLGMVRFMRDQDKVSGAADDESETVPDYAQGRPALPIPGISNDGYLDVSNSGNTAKLKMMMPEPPTSTALNLLLDVAGLDVPGMASRLNPFFQQGINLAVNTGSEQDYYSFWRQRTAGDPRYFEIPPGFVAWDQGATGGVFSKFFGFYPSYKANDPYSNVQPGVGVHWYPKRFREWDAFRSLLPGVTTGMSILDRMDRADLPVGPELALEVTQAVDEEFGLGLKQEVATDYPGVDPVDAAPRQAAGGVVEIFSLLGVSTAPISSTVTARSAGQRAYAKAIEGAAKGAPEVFPDVEPTPPPGGTTGIQPKPAGIRPERNGITGGR
jgi:hypothetical protein